MHITLSIPAKKELTVSSFSDIQSLDSLSRDGTFWVDIEDYSVEDLRALGETFSLNPLTMEDVSIGNQRIKVEDYQDYTFAVSKGVASIPSKRFESAEDEIFIVIRERSVLTFHLRKSVIVSHVLEALKNRIKNLKKESTFASMVMYLVFDFSVDSFYTSLGEVENWLSSVGEEVTAVASLKTKTVAGVGKLMSLITGARRNMGEMRVKLTQLRDAMSLAQRGTLKYVSLDMMPDFRDVFDHTFQLIETVDSYISRTGDVRDMYFTLRAAFTDNILRLLTVVATVFLPLTFITGFYGMNFTAGFIQPGSSLEIGFYSLMAAMIVIASTMLLVFKKKGWV